MTTGHPPCPHLCHSLSDWEVVEAYQLWDGTYSGLMSLQGYYGVSYRTLERAFRRLQKMLQQMRLEASDGRQC